MSEVAILLADDSDIRDLNRRFRGKDKTTDVLSFPASPETRNKFAGDIAISIDYAIRSAERFGLEPQQELKILILHGLIHLSGHDHEHDDGEMARLEARLRRKLGLPAGLIARSEAENGRVRSRQGYATTTRTSGTIAKGKSLKTTPRNR